MESVLWSGFELFSNYFDQFLFLYLVDSQLPLKRPNRFHTVIALLSLGSILTLLKQMPLTYSATFPAMLVVYLLYCYRFRAGSLWQRILWPIITIVTYFCIDQGLTIFMTRIPGFNMEALRSYTPQRFLTVCLYMLFCTIAIYLLSKVSPRSRNLPSGIQVISIVMALLCTIFSGVIFDLSPVALESESAWLLNMVTAGFMVTTVAWLFILDTLAARNAENLTLQIENQRLESEQRHADALQTLYDHLRDMRHDFTNQILALSGLAREGDLKGLTTHLQQWYGEIEAENHSTLTNFPQLDAIITTKLQLASSLNTRSEVLFIMPNEPPLSMVDLCSIIGNILDNALEALSEVPTEQRFISLRANTASNMWQICVENSSSGNYRRNEEQGFISTKTGFSRGIGLRRIKQLVEKNNGDLVIDALDKSFKVDILLPWTKL